MHDFTPEHAAVWFEIPVRDLGTAKAFYETVLQTRLRDEDNPPNPTAMFPVEDLGRGVSGHLYPSDKPARSGVTVHLLAPVPLEDTLNRVRQAGGRVVSDIVTIPDGRFAYALDPDGNSVGFFTRT